jgi:hypothetical protein
VLSYSALFLERRVKPCTSCPSIRATGFPFWRRQELRGHCHALLTKIFLHMT